jgi:hypothetical protein
MPADLARPAQGVRLLDHPDVHPIEHLGQVSHVGKRAAKSFRPTGIA